MSQYGDAIENLFDEQLSAPDYFYASNNNFYAYLELLLDLIEHAGTSDIISAVHEENSAQKIKYLAYCYSCVCAYNKPPEIAQKYVLPERFALSNEDAGKMITTSTLKKYLSGDICLSSEEKATHWILLLLMGKYIILI